MSANAGVAVSVGLVAIGCGEVPTDNIETQTGEIAFNFTYWKAGTRTSAQCSNGDAMIGTAVDSFHNDTVLIECAVLASSMRGDTVYTMKPSTPQLGILGVKPACIQNSGDAVIGWSPLQTVAGVQITCSNSLNQFIENYTDPGTSGPPVTWRGHQLSTMTCTRGYGWVVRGMSDFDGTFACGH